ncbi:MAG: hypothetical protein OXD48_00555, partial [Litoreibacter sp.]|nr:hypothetical protein [Litoreibacter sp.]
KQQQLMINELNHRVRNILSLVRSVSRQARRHNSSLESYSEAIEKRIQALAAAHDLASGDMRTAIAIRELIHIEIAPYNDAGRITLGGTEPFLRADIAPIFSLVIHELATNAVKYGALSVDDGRVDITLEVVDGGVTLAWREMDGPLVVPLNTRGFGSTLIEQAIPYEMGGTAELRFVRTGVEADLFLPNEILEKSGLAKPTASVTTVKTRPADQPKTIDLSTVSGLVLIVEDNFTIAKDTRDQLVAAGLKDVEMCSNADDALDILASEPVVFAILDVNLGPGKTSEPVALRLLRDDIPFFFVTGYSDTFDLDKRLSRVPRFTKPLSTHDLLAAIAAQLEHRA